MRDQEVLERVKSAQEGFIYEKKVDVDGYLVYHCHKPGTRVYSFELFIGREGISVSGDIGPIVWDGRTGLGFLAGGDVDYYVYSKLASVYSDKQEVDRSRVEEFLVRKMVAWLHEDWENEDGEAIPWEEPMYWSAEGHPPLEDVVSFFDRWGLNVDPDCTAWDLYFDLEGVMDGDNLQEVYEAAYKHADDVIEENFGKPAWGVMFSMYMACYAARKIQEQEET